MVPALAVRASVVQWRPTQLSGAGGDRRQGRRCLPALAPGGARRELAGDPAGQSLLAGHPGALRAGLDRDFPHDRPGRGRKRAGDPVAEPSGRTRRCRPDRLGAATAGAPQRGVAGIRVVARSAESLGAVACRGRRAQRRVDGRPGAGRYGDRARWPVQAVPARRRARAADGRGEHQDRGRGGDLLSRRRVGAAMGAHEDSRCPGDVRRARRFRRGLRRDLLDHRPRAGLDPDAQLVH